MNNLITMNVQELSTKEMKKTDGGWLNFVLWAGSAAIYLINNWEDAQRGYSDGYNGNDPNPGGN